MIFRHLIALPVVLLLIAATSLACSSSPAPARPQVDADFRVLIIHSYDDDFRWTHELGRGIVEGLGRGGYSEGRDYELRVFFMDTRVNYTRPEQIEERVSAAMRVIDEFRPDIVFVTDDLALERVAVPYAEKGSVLNLPFVFAGINGDPVLYGGVRSLEAPGGQITGAIERIPFLRGFEAMKRVFPNAQRVALIADPSPSSTAVVNEFRRENVAGRSTALQAQDMVQVATFAAWKERIQEFQTRADLIAVLNYHRLADEAGHIVPAREVVEWTLQNSRIPVVGLVSDWTADGLVMAVGNSGFRTGIYVGIVGARVLSGTPPGSIAIIDPLQFEMTFNLTTAERLNIRIPADALTEAGNVVR